MILARLTSVIAVCALSVSLAVFSGTQAQADNDALKGAVIGAGVGGLVGGKEGAVVGGVAGAIIGNN